eukprot:g4688.t1
MALLAAALLVLCMCQGGAHAAGRRGTIPLRSGTPEGMRAMNEARAEEGLHAPRARKFRVVDGSSGNKPATIWDEYFSIEQRKFYYHEKESETTQWEFPGNVCDNRASTLARVARILIAVNDMHATIVDAAKGSGVEVRYTNPVQGETKASYEEMRCQEDSKDSGSCFARIVNAYQLHAKMLQRLQADDAKVVQNALVSMGLEQDHLPFIVGLLKEFRASLLSDAVASSSYTAMDCSSTRHAAVLTTAEEYIFQFTHPTRKTWHDSDEVEEVWDLIQKNRVGFLKELLTEDPDLIQIRSRDGRGPLFWAYAEGKRNIVQLLLKKGAWPGALDASGKMPHQLLRGSESRSAEVKAQGDDDDDDLDSFDGGENFGRRQDGDDNDDDGDVDDDDDDDDDYVYDDDEEEEEEDVDNQGESGYDPEKVMWLNTPDTTNMWRIVHENNVNELEEWVISEPNIVHIRAEDGRGPLWWAYEYDRPEIIEILISAGAREDLKDAGGQLPREM